VNETPRLEFLDPSYLDDHPDNWKFHPPDQIKSLGELIGEFGWLKPLVFNERTKRLLDGHGRKAGYVNGDIQGGGSGGLVPVYIVDLPAELEAKALATLDPIGWTSVADKTKYDALLKNNGLLEASAGKIGELLKSVSRASTLLEKQEASQPEAQADVTIPLDSLWPSDNPWGVPCLDPALQAATVPYPVLTWGSIGHDRHMPGTWHFYTADSKFEPLWRKPKRVIASGATAIVESNFSTTDQQPLAYTLWHIYRKRWLGRYWQSLGLRLLVDLNVDATLNQPCGCLGDCCPNLLGVPRNWSSFASRAHANQPGSLVDEWRVAQDWSASERPTFLVVGGGKEVKRLAIEHGWIWVPEHQQLVHGAKAS
jgi:hypothetical protein